MRTDYCRNTTTPIALRNRQQRPTLQHFFSLGSCTRSCAGLYSVSSGQVNLTPGLAMGLMSLQWATCE
jgi:hypothetical protein